MKKVLFAAFILVISLTVKAQTDLKTIQEIQTVVNYYMDGGTFGDSLMFSKAFQPDGQMRFVRNDTLFNISLKDFMSRARNDGKKANRTTRIDHIQVYGTVATAKLTIEYPTFYFHDIMSLVKTKEGWKIVGKIFYREDKGGVK